MAESKREHMAIAAGLHVAAAVASFLVVAHELGTLAEGRENFLRICTELWDETTADLGMKSNG